MRLFIASALTCVVISGYGQTDTAQHRFSLYYAQLQFGNNVSVSQTASQQDFQKISSSGEPLLHFNEAGYNKQSFTVFNSEADVRLNAAFYLGNKRRSFLRIGLDYASVEGLDHYASQETTQRVDTLYSAQGTTPPIFVDSISRKSYRLSQSSKMIAIDLGWFIQTKPQKLWVWHAGVQLSPFLGVSNRINIYQDETHRVAYSDGAMPGNGAVLASFGSATVTSKSLYGARLAIPLGFSVKLSRKTHFLKRVALGLEASPALSYTKISGLTGRAGFYMAGQMTIKYIFGNRL